MSDEKYIAMQRLPKHGDIIYNPSTGFIMKCDHVREGICYSIQEEKQDTKCFIAQFGNGEFNKLMVNLTEQEEHGDAHA